MLLFYHYISKRYQKVKSCINLRVRPKGFCHPLRPLCTVSLLETLEYGQTYGLLWIHWCVVFLQIVKWMTHLIQTVTEQRLGQFWASKKLFVAKCFKRRKNRFKETVKYEKWWSKWLLKHTIHAGFADCLVFCNSLYPTENA